MIRYAKRVEIYFSVGSLRDKKRCRLIVGKRVEVLGADQAGDPIWIVVSTGLPDPEAVLAKALVKTFADLPPFEDRLYPLDISYDHQVIKIELGAWPT